VTVKVTRVFVRRRKVVRSFLWWRWASEARATFARLDCRHVVEVYGRTRIGQTLPCRGHHRPAEGDFAVEPIGAFARA
jgi:hypothetical protein